MANNGASTNNRGNAVLLSTTAIQLVGKGVGGSVSFPRTVAVQNVHGSHVAYLGFGEDVTTGNGWRILPGESITLDLLLFDELWACSNNSADVRIIVLNAGGDDV